MPTPTLINPAAVITRLHRMLNAHDPEAVAACFHPDYESVHPGHPERNLRGQAVVRFHWTLIFNSVPDFHAELCRSAVVGNTAWTEWRWEGTFTDGLPFESVGVMIFEIEGAQIIRSHVYSETIQTVGPDWDQILDELLSRKELSL
jgi:hypothetical protein